jgi:hypothetical protein
MSFMMMVGTGSAAVANPSVIGTTSGQAGVLLDNAKVAGAATVFDGSTVQAKDFSRLHLNNGTRLDLGADSKAQVFEHHASLVSGATEVQSAAGYEIDARTLKILPAASAIARVKLDGASQVMVTALNGSVNVLNRDGLLVAKVLPGAPLSFLPQAGAAAGFDNTGCVLQKSGAAILVDSTGNQVFELRGADLRKAVGNTTHVVGTTDASATPAGGASSVVKVTSATITKKGGCSDVATKVGATTAAAGLAAGVAGATAGGAAVGAAAGVAAGTAAAVGISTTAIVVGGVAAATAATLGGLAATGNLGNGNSTSP